MSKQRDNTTERDEPSGEKQEHKPGSYYYDDSTGYEVYNPDDDDEEDEDETSGQGEDLP